MDKKKSLMNLEKLRNIIKPMKRLELNKFVSKINKELKITNASKMKREQLETELLSKADIIIDMIDKDTENKLFDTSKKEMSEMKEEVTAKKPTKSGESFDELSNKFKELSKMILKEKDLNVKQKMMKESSKIMEKLTKMS